VRRLDSVLNSWIFGRVMIGLIVLVAAEVARGAFGESEDNQSRSTLPRSLEIDVRNREDHVDIRQPSFEMLGFRGRSRSSDDLATLAWYDSASRYLIVRIGGVADQYCAMPVAVWNDLQTASSANDYYVESVRGRFSCQGFVLPTYP
jgi:hypothetical protein